MRETGLPIVVRLDGKPIVLLGEGEAAEAKRRLLERAGAVIVTDPANARLAIVAIVDDGAAAEAAARLKAAGLLVNVVDRPDLCDFTLPAIVDRSPVLVAVATGGASAGLAAALRQRIEQLLPARLGDLARALGSARSRMRERYPDARDRRLALARALEMGGVLDPLAASSTDFVDQWLAGEDHSDDARVVTITLRSDNPDDLTLGEARSLAQADRICHRSDVSPEILLRARADAERIECAVVQPGPGLTIDLSRASPGGETS